MMRTTSCLFLTVGLLHVAGCGSGLEKFPLTPVSGVVTCNGTPVAKAIVYFEPVRSDKSAQTGKQGFGLTDEQGRYTITTYDENDGAVIGKHIVRVGKSETSPPCNCALNAMVELTQVDVAAGAPQIIDLTLNKKSRSNPDEILEVEDEDEQ